MVLSKNKSRTIKLDFSMNIPLNDEKIFLLQKQSKDHCGIEGDEGSTMVEDSVCPSKATILQHERSKVGKVNTESLAKPAVMRAGADGESHKFCLISLSPLRSCCRILLMQKINLKGLSGVPNRKKNC